MSDQVAFELFMAKPGKTKIVEEIEEIGEMDNSSQSEVWTTLKTITVIGSAFAIGYLCRCWVVNEK